MPGEDWAAQTADTIDRVVGSVRSKTTEPLERLVRIMVYGTAVAIIGTAVLVFVFAALLRGLDVAMPGDVWSAHAVLGGIFTLGGLLCWRKRRA